MKRRIVCLLLAAVLLLQLSGCKKPDMQSEPRDKESVSQPDCYGWEALSEECGIYFLKPPGSSDVFAEAPLGFVEDRTYTNPHLGFTFTLDSQWIVFPAEDLQEIPEFTAQLFSDSDFAEYIAAAPQFFDVMAAGNTGRCQISVVYQRQPDFLQAPLAEITEEEFIDSLLKQEALLTEAYAAANIEVLELAKKTVTFLGEPHFVLYTRSNAAGTPYYTLQLVNLSLEKYAVTITLGSTFEDHTEELLQYFSAL